MVRKKQCGGGGENEVLVGDNSTDDFQLQIKKRCAWVTPTTGSFFFIYSPSLFSVFLTSVFELGVFLLEYRCSCDS
jgi:hypothetical protein